MSGSVTIAGQNITFENSNHYPDVNEFSMRTDYHQGRHIIYYMANALRSAARATADPNQASALNTLADRAMSVYNRNGYWTDGQDAEFLRGIGADYNGESYVIGGNSRPQRMRDAAPQIVRYLTSTAQGGAIPGLTASPAEQAAQAQQTQNQAQQTQNQGNEQRGVQMLSNMLRNPQEVGLDEAERNVITQLFADAYPNVNPLTASPVNPLTASPAELNALPNAPMDSLTARQRQARELIQALGAPLVGTDSSLTNAGRIRANESFRNRVRDASALQEQEQCQLGINGLRQIAGNNEAPQEMRDGAQAWADAATAAMRRAASGQAAQPGDAEILTFVRNAGKNRSPRQIRHFILGNQQFQDEAARRAGITALQGLTDPMERSAAAPIIAAINNPGSPMHNEAAQFAISVGQQPADSRSQFIRNHALFGSRLTAVGQDQYRADGLAAFDYIANSANSYTQAQRDAATRLARDARSGNAEASSFVNQAGEHGTNRDERVAWILQQPAFTGQVQNAQTNRQTAQNNATFDAGITALRNRPAGINQRLSAGAQNAIALAEQARNILRQANPLGLSPAQRLSPAQFAAFSLTMETGNAYQNAIQANNTPEQAQTTAWNYASRYVDWYANMPVEQQNPNPFGQPNNALSQIPGLGNFQNLLGQFGQNPFSTFGQGGFNPYQYLTSMLGPQFSQFLSGSPFANRFMPMNRFGGFSPVLANQGYGNRWQGVLGRH